jgi:hypothetical protein
MGPRQRAHSGPSIHARSLEACVASVASAASGGGAEARGAGRASARTRACAGNAARVSVSKVTTSRVRFLGGAALSSSLEEAVLSKARAVRIKLLLRECGVDDSEAAAEEATLSGGGLTAYMAAVYTRARRTITQGTWRRFIGGKVRQGVHLPDNAGIQAGACRAGVVRTTSWVATFW